MRQREKIVCVWIYSKVTQTTVVRSLFKHFCYKRVLVKFCCVLWSCEERIHKKNITFVLASFLLFLKTLFVHFHFVWKVEGYTERDLTTADSLTKCLWQSRLGQTDARDLELHPRLACGWQRSTHLRHHLIPPRVPLMKLGQRKCSLGLNSGTQHEM